MKILCPTDFSSCGNTGVEYAARLAQELKASLTLIFIQEMYLTEGASMFSGGQPSSFRESKEADKRLLELSNLIKNEFQISCNYLLDYSFTSFENKVAATSNNYDLVVTGTNGTETLNQFYSGSHSYKLAMEAKCPVLIVTDGSQYRGIKNVVFATSFLKNDAILVEQLDDFINYFNPNLHIVHVSHDESPAAKETFKAFCNLAAENLTYKGEVNYQRIVSDEPVDALESYLNKINADILVLSAEKHDLIYRLFHTNLIKEITAYNADFPILIVHK